MKRALPFLIMLIIFPLALVAQRVDYNKIILPVGATDISFEERLVQLAWQNNPASHIAQKEVAAAGHEVKAIGSQWLRHVGVTANINEYSLEHFDDPDFEGLNFYPGYNVFVTLPLSTFFERPHAKRAAVERYEASQDRVNQLKLSLRAEVLKLYNAFKRDETIWGIRRDALADEESNYLLLEEKFKNGTATVEEYLAAQKSRNEHRIQVVEAETQYLMSKLELEALIGVKLEEVK
ncbi:MAG: TolC family protein [Cyclobacteriaceae bacterium]|jgi:outer membrane protein TolC|nr:TolC family protein [Cyclobacteriaceae bacterium]